MYIVFIGFLLNISIKNISNLQKRKNGGKMVDYSQEVLKEVARQFPDLGNGNLILLDENYVPFGKKNYMDGNYKPLNEEAYPK